MSGRTRTPVAARRKRVWADRRFIMDFTAAALQSQDLLDDFRNNGGSTQGVTIAAVRLQALWLSGVVVLGPASVLSVGLMINEAGPGGSISISPVGRPYVDWMINFDVFLSPQGSAGASGVPYGQTFELYNKSMRKCEEINDTLVFNALEQASVGSDPTQLSVHTRTLLLLP